MTPRRVVEHPDVVEDIGSCVIARCIDLSADALALEQLEEALGHGVVVAVAAPAHAADQVVVTQERLSLMPCELAALIRVHGDRAGGLAPPQGHHQRIQD